MFEQRGMQRGLNIEVNSLFEIFLTFRLVSCHSKILLPDVVDRVTVRTKISGYIIAFLI